MKFLRIDGKLQKDAQGKFITVPDNYDNELLTLNGELLKTSAGLIGNKYKPAKGDTDCITFTGETSDFTLKAKNKEWDGTVEYSTDHETWTEWDGSEISSNGQKLYLRGSGNTKFYTSEGARFVLSARAACSGNIQTLLEYSNPPTNIPAVNCYHGMFYGCTSLTTAPELPATTLANGCYSDMFRDCTSLRISSTQSLEYPTAWRIPSSGTISSIATNWSMNMLIGTGGTFTFNPSRNTTYYGAWSK